MVIDPGHTVRIEGALRVTIQDENHNVVDGITIEDINLIVAPENRQEHAPLNRVVMYIDLDNKELFFDFISEEDKTADDVEKWLNKGE